MIDYKRPWLVSGIDAFYEWTENYMVREIYGIFGDSRTLVFKDEMCFLRFKQDFDL